MPAILYGHRQEALAIEADAKTLEKLWHRAGRNALIELTVEGHAARKVLIREFQIHPRSGRPVHVDFFAPNLMVRAAADVPVVLHGEAPAEAQRIGIVLQVIQTVRVEALPTALPSQLSADVTHLDAADSVLTAGELPLPEGVALLTDPGEVVARIGVRRGRGMEEEEGEAAAEGEPAAGAGAGEEPAQS